MTNKKVATKFMTVLALGGVLTGCGMFGDPGAPKGPNEFEVVSRTPLIIPPEADLRPPRPGEPRPHDIDPQNRAVKVLFPEVDKTPPIPSEGEQKLLSKAGGGGQADVRSLGNRKDQGVAKKSLILADLLAMGERQFEPDNVTVTRAGNPNRN